MANRYWVGGTANWDGTPGLKWATTSGGAGGASVPISVDDVFFDAASGPVTCSYVVGGFGIKSLNCTGFTGTLHNFIEMYVYGDITFVAGMTFITNQRVTIFETATLTSAGKNFAEVEFNAFGGTLTLNGDLTLSSGYGFILTQGTLNLANFNLTCGEFVSSNSNTRAINFGSGAVSLSGGGGGIALSMSNATNFTYTGTGSFTRGFGLTQTTTMAFGVTGGTISNAPNLTLSVSGNVSLSSGSFFKNVNCTGSTSFVSGTYNACGSLTLAASGSHTNLAPTFRASGVITSNGRTLGNTTINGTGITVALADAIQLGSGNILTLTQGTFDASNFNVTCGVFNSNNSNVRTLNMGSGVWTLTLPAGTVWNTSSTTGLTLNSGTSTISATGSFGKIFAGGGLNYYNLNHASGGGLTITGSNAFNNVTNTVQPTTIIFDAGTTQTVSDFGLSGTFGNLVTIESSIAGSQFNLSKSSGAVNVQCLAIKDSNATGGATWNAIASSNLGNNTGWLFSGGNMLLMFM